MVDIVDVLKTKREGLEVQTRAARNELAGTVFALNTISESMLAAAARGFDRLAVTPPVPVDLRNAVASAETVAALSEAGFTVEWEKRQPRPEEPEYWVMVVSWRKAT